MTNRIIEIQNVVCPKCDSPIRCFDKPCLNCGEDMSVEIIKKGDDVWGKVWIKFPIKEDKMIWRM